MTSCFQKCVPIPQRWIIAAMGFLAFFNAYTLRICLSMAITKMAKPINNTSESVDEICPEYESQVLKNTTITPSGTFEWDEYTQGIILSSFYWGYIITHIPGGLLANRFGAKITVGLAVLFTSILTVITPTATQWADAPALISLRFLMGLCEGVIQPGMSRLLAQWIPPNERSIVASLTYSGIKFGILVASIASGIIMRRSSDNWPCVFHLFGGIGILWYVFWLFTCYDSPREHPFITAQENRYLHERLASHTHEKTPPFPWKQALTSKPFLALVLMQCGHDWCSYTIMSDLPKYMHSVLRLPVHLNGYASSMHNVSSWIFTILVSWLSDRFIARGLLSRTNARKTNTAISSAGPALLLLLAVYAGCDVILAVSLITLGLTLGGAALPGIKVNVLDLSPNYAGVLMGISNGMGAFAGILAPYTIGVLAPNQSLSEWRLIFWIVAAVFFVTTLNFLMFASGEVQPWNDPNFLRSKERKSERNHTEDIDLLPINRPNVTK